ncbi:M48 family metalloprotease [Halosolutus gelatinilyticus]|uniref:M48 family metalloprotease n=1 Tax=Halosolutus gelatinilyticus TaxID=2931975 RepID=UPI001FF2DCF3|nr:M48 family metalloprotease [Halosolutus gelatinilyticus]
MNWTSDRRLQGRMVLALALTLLGYAALFGVVVTVFSDRIAVGFGAVLLIALAVSVTQADRIAYLATKAIAIDRDQHPELHDAVERLARQADLPVPPIAVIPSDEANALSAGTGDRTVVCVTTGLLKALSEDELEAVLAHELAHLKNADSSVMTVAGFPMAVSAMVLSLAGRSISAASFVFGWPLVIGIYLLFVGLPIYLVSLPGIAVLSRYREFAADRGAVAITGDPYALASALATLHGSAPPETDLRRVAGFNAFCIVPSSAIVPPRATHPPTHERIRRLRELHR